MLPQDRFDKFEPHDERLAGMQLSRYAGSVTSGRRTWCHSLQVEGGEVGHLHYAAGTTVGAGSVGGMVVVFRLGGVRVCGDGEAAVFHEFALYPDGVVPPSRYLEGAHEFVVWSERVPAGIATGPLPLPPSLIEKVWRLILRLRETGQAGPCQAEFDAVVDGAAASAGAPLAPPLLRAQRLLDADWSGGRPSARVAAQAGVSTAYLCRLFKSAFGTSVSRYQRLLRVSRAAGLLWGSCLPIDAVAAVCGFTDQSHLTRQMLDLFALTPSVFRRLAPCVGNARLAHIDLLSEPMQVLDACALLGQSMF